MEKNIEISLLYDFYGQLLKKQQQEAVTLYYNDDLSLSEIASQLGITRQGVRDCVKRAEERLYGFEEKLGLKKRFNEVEAGLREIEELAETLGNSERETADRIISVARSLHE